MEDVPFNIEDFFLNNVVPVKITSSNVEEKKTTNQVVTNDTDQDIEVVVKRLEDSHTDITDNYNDWLQIGFALAHELGEMGRIYFHRISSLNVKYNAMIADKQFDNCLKTHHEGTTIKTFFYLAKQASIDITPEKKNEVTAIKLPVAAEVIEKDDSENNDFKTPLFPDTVYDGLPVILQDSCALFEKGIEKDILLISELTVLSACLPNIEGVYFNKSLSAHLYLFVTGPAASGKGTMGWARYIADGIHQEMVNKSIAEHYAYKVALEAYENLPKNQKVSSGKPEEPKRYLLFIPANCSTSALIQLLSENNFRGIIFESEADTLANTAKQDWSDSSDLYRKAFHHENTSLARRQNKELIEINDPHLAICLSGTPKQVHNLMPDVENGLFSRFMYYAFEDTRGFLNPFESFQSIDYEAFFTQKGYEVLHFYEKLSKLSKPINFELTKKQGIKFTQFFQNLLDKNKILLSRDLDANSKRLGVITFRIAMILTSLHLMDAEIGNPLPLKMVCTDCDFEKALTLAGVLESHAVAVYQQMPKIVQKGKRLTFYEKLPLEFNRKMYLQLAKELGIFEKTADKWISIFTKHLLSHDYNSYKKV